MTTPATYHWCPSTARVVVLDGFGIQPRGTLNVPLPPLSWPAKDPGDTLDYVVDISQAIAGDDGDAIATLDVAITPNAAGDLTLQSAVADGTEAILWLAAGASGTTYSVNVTIGTNSGRAIARTITLPVVALTLQQPPANAITDQLGAPLEDQNLAPITTS